MSRLHVYKHRRSGRKAVLVRLHLTGKHFFIAIGAVLCFLIGYSAGAGYWFFPAAVEQGE